PPLVLLENVTGFLTSHGGSDFREALSTLNNLGYSVDAFILDAVNFVPQSRQRLFVIGILDSVGNEMDSEFQLTERVESETRPGALANFIEANRQLRWKIRPLPAPPLSRTRLKDILEELPH